MRQHARHPIDELRVFARLSDVLKQHHTETWRHCQRTAVVVRRLALACGRAPEHAARLAHASRLHDLGKLGIDLRILTKAGCLEPAEFAQIREHSRLGATMLRDSGAEADSMLALAASMALCHHEHWNGRGYPFALSGDAIPFHARLLAVADCYEALRAPRAYKTGCDHQTTMMWLCDSAGRQFDADIVDRFVTAGALVEHDWERAYGALPEPGHEDLTLHQNNCVPTLRNH